MAFDSNTRNKLQRMVASCRDLLTGEFEDQLQEHYGIYPTDGRVLDIEKLPVQDDETVAVARLLRSRISHIMAGNTVALPDAVRRVLREQAFTVLNRFAALRMAEERGLIPESIAGGVTSKGAQVFADLAGPGLGGAYDRYRVYLDRLLDELALDLRVLFDRFSPLGLLFPRENVLTELLASINASDIAQVWAADEAIGWIYQYFNDPEERKQMRNESSAPRNSRELAVRNQFFTPRYVVEFLTDNTLGRIWYEMCRGKTRLAGQCRYMVRRPKEIFLNPRFLSSDSAARPWVKELAMGDFASAPEDATWSEISQVALLFDGYEVAEQLGLGDLGDWALPHLETLMAGKECGLKELWELWLVLFVAQRRYLKEGLETRFPEIGGGLRFVWNTWRAVAVSPPAGTNTSQEELLQQPVIIPVRFPKDPREIRMLDPACGSMHFGLYAFDLYEVIYEEALQSEFGVRDDLLHDYGFERYPRVTINAGSVTLRRGSQAFSDYHSCEIPTGDAWVVIAEKADGGDGVQLARPYILNADAKFRVPFARRVPLESFDYAQALKENWFTTAVGEKFLRESRCFEFSECFASEDEALAAYRRDIPRLIIEHNIHGVDIDPRAVQIAGLSLWLRAQRAWKEQSITALDRPTIRKSNIVCAEPMPGDEKLLGEFADSLQPRFLGQIVRQVWKSMQLAGEAGSLLKIEEEIADWVKEAKRQWTAMPKGEQLSLFESPAKYGRKQEELDLDLSGITDAAFWEEAEERIYDALREFSQSVGEVAYQRRLFAEDAARGFAFIDICRQRYDVTLMNPPFGDASLPSRAYIEDTYGDTKGDVYKAFVECFHARLVPAGYLGIISSRTGFFLGQSEDWRTRVVLRLFRPIALADLGMGVLDAMVEVAAYVLRSLSAAEARDLTHSIVPVLEKVARDSQDRFSLPKWQAARSGLKRHQALAELEHLEAHGFVQRSSGDTVRYTPRWPLVKTVTALPEPVFPPLVCVRALGEKDKGTALLTAMRGSNEGNLFVTNPSGFAEVPGSPFAYWSSSAVRGVFARFEPFESGERCVRVGLQTSDDFRFVRLSWEPDAIEGYKTWWPFARGGAFSLFYSDLKLLVHWADEGKEIKAWAESLPGCSHWSRRIASADSYFQPGLTWPLRAAAFSPQVLPARVIFSVRGYAVLAPIGELRWLLGILSSRAFDYFFKLLLGRFGFPEFIVGILQKLPLPTADEKSSAELAALASEAWRIKRENDTTQATSHAFSAPASLAVPGITLVERAAAWAARVRTSEETVAAIQAEIDDHAFSLYGLDAADRAALTSTLATEATGDVEAEAGEDEDTEAADATALATDLWAYALGCAFGRWDIRYATGERPAPPAPAPFAPLPVCPPGMLQNAAGLPAAPGDVPASYPVRITWPGLLVDDPAHQEDIERRVGEVLAVLFPGRADAIANEACALLGAKSLREWFRKPAGFFADHLKRYSKSRRQAPIYWPLSTASGRYTLWIYYHRLTDQTLFQCVTDFIKPKIVEVESDLARLRADEGPRTQIDEMVEFLAELTGFRDELLRIAALPWKPNLNDGVLITASPLWSLFRLPKWQKDLKACWLDLEKGEYDWSHLAYSIWPDRVKRACETDRSLAIAHGLEHLCKVEPPKAKGKRGKKKADAELLEQQKE